jgi:hypothetical protein
VVTETDRSDPADGACGVFFVAGAYAGVVSWGPAKIAGYAASSNAWQVLAHNVWGFAFTISLGAIFAILLYMSACISVPFLYLRQLRSEFNVVKHALIPLVGVLIFIGPLIATVYPVPPYPLNIIPYIDLGWLLLGLGTLAWLWRNRRDSVLATRMIMLDAAEPAGAVAETIAEPGVGTEPKAGC